VQWAIHDCALAGRISDSCSKQVKSPPKYDSSLSFLNGHISDSILNVIAIEIDGCIQCCSTINLVQERIFSEFDARFNERPVIVMEKNSQRFLEGCSEWSLSWEVANRNP
jgi:hypothetical protein